jgi:hypothetical protein
MGSRLRGFGLPLAVAAGCLAVAAPASAGTDQFSGTVANGGCVTARTVTVAGPSRIEATTSSTAQNNTNIYAEIVGNGKTVAGGSFASYDTPAAGTYQIRVCATYQEQSPPNLQYTGLLGTGPAGQPVLTQPSPQPQPPTNGTPGTKATIAYSVTGKVAIRTSSGLAWFTITTTRTGSQTLRIIDPRFGKTRVVTGLHSLVSGSTVRVLGNNGLSLTLGHNRLTFSSTGLKASGKIVRGTYKVVL